MNRRQDIDVLVVGGGPSGIAAAISAARLGARVALVERYGFLGGTMTAVTLGSICGLYAVSDDAVVPVVRGFAEEFFDRMRKANGAGLPKRWLKTASLPYDPFILKIVADEMIQESGVDVAFHTLATDVVMEGERIVGVVTEGPGGRLTRHAGVVIDASGDADVAALAGAPFEHDLGNSQAPTMMVRFGGVDTDLAMRLDREDLRSCLERAVQAGFDLPRTAGGMFSERPGIVHLNVSRVLIDDRAPNPFDVHELTQAEMMGRRQVQLYAQAFRKFVPGFENCYVLDTGAEIGVRESRRIVGRQRLEADDVLNEGRFENAIACCAWPLEEHGGGRATKWVFLKPGTYYQIPFGVLVPKTIEGLLVAGRCVSTSHDAQASLRVAGPCMALGQAAGVAAALSLRGNTQPSSVPIGDVQRTLIQQGAFLGDPLPVS